MLSTQTICHIKAELKGVQQYKPHHFVSLSRWTRCEGIGNNTSWLAGLSDRAACSPHKHTNAHIHQKHARTYGAFPLQGAGRFRLQRCGTSRISTAKSGRDPDVLRHSRLAVLLRWGTDGAFYYPSVSEVQGRCLAYPVVEIDKMWFYKQKELPSYSENNVNMKKIRVWQIWTHKTKTKSYPMGGATGAHVAKISFHFWSKKKLHIPPPQQIVC